MNRSFVFLLMVTLAPASAMAVSAEVTIDSNLPSIPTGLASRGDSFYGGAVTGVNSLGTIYQLVPPSKSGTKWSTKVIYAFSGQGDGAYPSAPLTLDKAGNLYGSTFCGGLPMPSIQGYCSNNAGTLFKLTPPSGSQISWSKQTIYQFRTPVQPKVKLAIDGAGSLYLAYRDNVLQFTPPASGSGAYTMITLPIVAGYEADNSGVVLGRAGRLYGVARAVETSAPVYDIVYQLTPPSTPGGQWKSRTLKKFAASAHVGQIGLSPDGHLFGTTSPTGAGCGRTDCLVFELVPAQGEEAWTEQVIHDFAGDPLGSPPNNGSNVPYVASDYQLTFAKGGFIYGAITPSQAEGAANSTIYRLAPPTSGQTSWTETAFYTFTGAPNGFSAGTPMYVTGNGRVYGTAIGGKIVNNEPQSIAFRIAVP